jgi:tripartite motif-containing protein 71
MGKIKRNAAKKKNKKKSLGKGAKLFLMFFLLVILVLVIYLFVDQIQKSIAKGKTVLIPIDMVIGASPEEKFLEPKDVAVDSENDVYVSDFGANKISKFDSDGKPIFSIGKMGNHPGDDKGPLEFNQPSGLWVSLKGTVYVADSFNHRIQVFDSKGKFLKMWSHSFFGPKGIVGDNNGNIYVVDTGNHKIVVFDESGNFIKEFGGHGTSDGKFDEPIGCGFDSKGVLYISDSNNNRIEKFNPNKKNGEEYLSSFKVSTWHGKNLEFPYLAIYNDNIFTSNASLGAVLRYDLDGKLIAIYKKQDGFSNVQGVAVDTLGRVYVTEVGLGRVDRFNVPAATANTLK